MIITIIPVVTASYLSMQSSITTTENGTIITVTNLGDESAYNVQLSMDINGQKKISDLKSQLGMRETFEWEMPLDAELKNSGKYPLILTTNYQDANSYPFSAISVSTFDHKQSTISDIAAKINNIELSDEETLELTIKNTAETTKNLNIRMIAPKELTAEKDKLSIKLPANTQTTINFEIKKFSALAGSSYVVFAVIEHDEDGRHYTIVTNGIVNVVEKQNIFTNQTLLTVLLVILAVIFIYAQKKKLFLTC